MIDLHIGIIYISQMVKYPDLRQLEMDVTKLSWL